MKGEGKVHTSEEMIDLFESWVNEFPIITIEDGLDEEDWTDGRSLLKTWKRRFS